MMVDFGEGSFGFHYLAERDWPPTAPVVFDFPSGNNTHSVHVTCNPEGQIRAKIYHVDGRFYSLVSPKLLRPVSATIKCAFRWSDEEAAMAVAGTIVSKSSDTDIYTKSTLTIPEEQWEPDGKVSTELLAAAEISRENRTRSVKDRKSTISDTKRLRTLEEDLASLSDRGLALYDLLKLIENGKDYHLYGVSAALRVLICTGGQKPLLQRVAGHLDADLMIYGDSPNAYEKSIAAGILPQIADFTMAAISARTGLYQMDLSDWLTHTGFVFNNTEISNNDVVKLLADSDVCSQ